MNIAAKDQDDLTWKTVLAVDYPNRKFDGPIEGQEVDLAEYLTHACWIWCNGKRRVILPCRCCKDTAYP